MALTISAGRRVSRWILSVACFALSATTEAFTSNEHQDAAKEGLASFKGAGPDSTPKSFPVGEQMWRAIGDRRHLLERGSLVGGQDGHKGGRKRALISVSGATPPMGWSSWNAEGENVTEKDMIRAADALVSTGLRDAGYVYVNLDDGWAGYERDANGDLTVDKESFPSGIRSLADYIHSKGLKFGLYSSAGPEACSGRLGSLLHEDRDARWFANQGVDFLKYDSCDDGSSGMEREERFRRMRDALAKVDRPIYYAMGYFGDSICSAGRIGNSWRTFFDIYSSMDRVFVIADENNKYAACQGPHTGWNDADSLQIGRLEYPGGEPNLEGERTQMSLWSIMKSPLIIGYAVTQMSEKRLAILKNEEVIAINQDALGKQATKRYNASGQEVWAGPLSGGRLVVALVNRNKNAAQNVSVDWRTVGLEPNVRMTARDVWERKSIPGSHKVNLGPFLVAPEGTVLLILFPVQNPWYIFWDWNPSSGGFITVWSVALAVGLVAVLGLFAVWRSKGFRFWGYRGVPRGSEYKRTPPDSPGSESVPLQDRSEKKSSSLRTQRSGLRREASTRISRSFDEV